MNTRPIPTLALAACAWALSLLSPAPSRAQKPASPMRGGAAPPVLERLATLVAVAETLGAQHARDSAATRSVRRCVDATGSDIAASGEFQVRGFASYPEVWRSGFGKLSWWTTQPALGDTLVVRIQRRGDSTAVDAFRSPRPTRTGRGELFYPSGIHLPTPGDWLFVAKAGKHWGCFAFTF